jgi:hypothetical protein
VCCPFFAKELAVEKDRDFCLDIADYFQMPVCFLAAFSYFDNFKRIREYPMDIPGRKCKDQDGSFND